MAKAFLCYFPIVDKWISFGGGSGANVVELLKSESDEISFDPDRGRGGLFLLYSADEPACRFDDTGEDRFGGACGFYFAHPDPGGAFCRRDRCRAG